MWVYINKTLFPKSDNGMDLTNGLTASHPLIEQAYW